MKRQQIRIKKVKNPTFASLDRRDFDKIVRASKSLISVINGQKKKEKENFETEQQIKEFMGESDLKMRKRFEDIIGQLDKVGAVQEDKKIIGQIESIKKSLKGIMMDMMYIVL